MEEVEEEVMEEVLGEAEDRSEVGGAKARVPRPFPMELSSGSGGSNTGDDENLTNSGPRTPSEHSQLSDSSNDDESGSLGCAQDGDGIRERRVNQ